jgi:hypothetical protein
MIKEFFKRIFCIHDYEEVAIFEMYDRISIKRVCRKCGKEYWDTIIY